MLKRFILFGLFFSFFMILACGPKIGQETSGVKQASEPGIIPVEKSGWEAQWQQVLKEAKKEGRVVVYGPPIPEVRQGFTEAFQKRYPGITLEYTAMGGAQASPRIKAERTAGLYVVDIHIGGTTTILSQLREYARPINQFLILPEVKDTKAWLDSRLDFADNAEEINLVFTIESSPRLAYNSNQVDPSEINSWWDLVKSKWMEKIIMWDPRISGSGLATATFWYLHPELGLDYIKAFVANRPVLTRDTRIQTETVSHGKYSMAVAPDPPVVNEFINAGAPVKWPKIMKEGTYSSAAYGSVVVMDKNPHPNATIVFLNWLLGKEGQTIWSTASNFASRRLDVPTEHLNLALRPVVGAQYSPNYKEAVVMKKDEIAPQLNKIFAGF